MRSSTLSIASLALVAQSLAAYVPSEPWSTLTPTQTLAGATTDYVSTFAISIDPIPTSTASASATLKKRDNVTQIGDGQIQATTKTESTTSLAPVVTQIGDGQIQATTATTAAVVTQIGDGQIQATTATTAAVVTQIGDGQIQATTATAAAVVTQIGDGQIQATTATTAAVVTQIGDGQIQATTSTADDVVTQIGDGQIQGTTTTADDKTTDDKTATSTESTSTSTSTSTSEPDFPVSCKTNNTLSMTLKDSILTDAKGRVGSIVANRQFQFDGPPPQAGAIYAAGWGISEDGKLAIGNTTVFYQCLSGNFYNLYDEEIGGQCEPVYLRIVDLIDC